jgi:N-acetylneuraminic acid mutarotase
MLIALSLIAAFTNPPIRAADSPNSWAASSPMPTPRGGLGLAVVNGKIYAIGGLSGNNQLVSTNEEYNPITNQWTSKMPMPTARTGFAIVVYQGKIFVIGGTVGNNGYVGNNEMYDPVTNTWQTKASMPTPRADLSANIIDDKIFLIGGKRYASAAPFYGEADINEVYDPTTDTWKTKTSIPTAVTGYGSVVLDKNIYIFGGSKVSSTSGSALTVSNNQVYNSQTDTWSMAAALPDPASYGAAIATEGLMAPVFTYFMGGLVSDQVISKTQIFNHENNSWSYGEPMLTPRAYLGLAVLNDVLYAIGGFDGQAWLSTNEQYIPVGYGRIPPKVQITSPENRTYIETKLVFTVNRGVDWMGYSLDNQANVTVASEIVLSNLTDGDHAITMYANDSLGNMGISNTVFFATDTKPPIIDILLPQNRTYDSTDIQLTFSLNEAATNISYSLDGQEKISIIGNVTLPALSNGSHKVTLYATDETGNSGEKTIYFSILPFPMLGVTAGATIVIIVLAIGYIFFKRKKPTLNKDKKSSKVSATTIKENQETESL